jgi:hypothetical protein
MARPPVSRGPRHRMVTGCRGRGGVVVADPVQRDGDVGAQDQVVAAEDDLDLGARQIRAQRPAGLGRGGDGLVAGCTATNRRRPGAAGGCGTFARRHRRRDPALRPAGHPCAINTASRWPATCGRPASTTGAGQPTRNSGYRAARPVTFRPRHPHPDPRSLPEPQRHDARREPTLTGRQAPRTRDGPGCAPQSCRRAERGVSATAGRAGVSALPEMTPRIPAPARPGRPG